MNLSIIIPAYNEESNILRGCLAYVYHWVQCQPINTEIIVVNDGSTDHTGPLSARHLRSAGRVVHIEHAGKAAAIMAGLRECHGDLALLADFDQATPIKEYSQLKRLVDDGFDFVIGSRGADRPGAPLVRRLMSRAQAAARRHILGMTYRDTQCGFKLYDRRKALDVLEHMYLYNGASLRTLRGPCTSSGFDVEFLFVARLLGYTIAECPVVWHHQETRRVRPIHDAIQGMRELLAIRAAARRGHYQISDRRAMVTA